MTTKKDIGLAVKFLRKKAGLRQKDVAKKINPKSTSINRISVVETGSQNYKIDILFKIAEALNCDVADFFTFGRKPIQPDAIEKVFEEFKNKLREEFKKYEG